VSFIDLTPIRSGRTPTPPLRIGVNSVWNRDRQAMTAIVYVDRSLAAEFKWKPGPMRVQLGTGTDAGKLLLCPAKSGYSLTLNGIGRALRLTIPNWKGAPHKPLEAEYRVIDQKSRLVEITLPDWRKPSEGGRHVTSIASGETRPTAGGGGEATAPPARTAIRSLEAP
jgi:hypothetical protein